MLSCALGCLSKQHFPFKANLLLFSTIILVLFYTLYINLLIKLDRLFKRMGLNMSQIDSERMSPLLRSLTSASYESIYFLTEENI